MEQQLQQAQAAVNTLKVRVFDLQEALQGQEVQLKEMSAVLQRIVNAAGVHGDEEGNVTLEQIAEFIEAHFSVEVPAQEELAPIAEEIEVVEAEEVVE